jgi:uncharacterized protein YcgI (DUF1989 family)
MTTAAATEIVIPAAEGRAFELAAGQQFKLSSPEGGQCADFFAFTPDLGEWLSPMHTWVASRHVRPRAGDAFLSQRRRPLLDFAEDHASGVHDMLLAACDTERYRLLGAGDAHRSCAENLREAMGALGLEIPIVPQPVNFFANTVVDSDGTMSSPANPVPAGASVVVKARTDLVCTISACPFDVQSPGWIVNAEGRLSELKVEILA